MMAKNTKKLFAGIFALSAAVILSACDPVKALPTNYDKEIVTQTVDGKESGLKLEDNQLGDIWESITGGKTEFIHNKVIENIAYNQLGYFYDEMDGTTLVEKGIKNITSDDDIKTFINKHKGVFITDKDEALAGTSDEEAIFQNVRKPRFEAFKKDIESRIAKKLYEEVSGSTFVDKNGMFHEHKFAKAHYYSSFDIKGIVVDGKLVEDDPTNWHQAYITADIDKEVLVSTTDVHGVDKVLHLERYQDYVGKKILPDIYKEKLIEEYIYSQKTATLGRTYARKVNYVKLAYDKNTNYEFAQKLMKQFADSHINSNFSEKPNFELVANTWRGFQNLGFTSGKLSAIIADSAEEISVAGYTASDIKTRLLAEGYVTQDFTDYLGTDSEEAVVLNYAYIKESKIGALFERYLKACRAVIDEGKHQLVNSKDKSELSTFTNNGDQSRVKGVKSELTKLVLEDYTVSDWGLKNGGFSDLPTVVRDRLFNINVSNAVDSFEHYEGEDTEHPLGSYPAQGTFSYVRAIGGKNRCFLNKTDAQKYEDNHYSYLYDVDSSLVIVNIEEAASSAKLDINDPKVSYKKTHADDKIFIEKASREIAQLLGTKDSYKTEAYEHFLAKYNLSFNDQEIYDYFVSTYPDTFGEND